MEAKVIQVTPVMAQKWLNEKNPHNRKIYENTVEMYASDMRRGLWALNNQGIGFDENGDLIDGQHRLQAIVWSGVTIPLLVVRGIPKNYYDGHLTQLTIDKQKPRSTGDQLTLSFGIENANLKSAIIRSLITLIVSKNIKASDNAIWDIMQIYRDEIESIVANRKTIKGLIFAPALGAFVFVAKCYHKETIEFEKSYFEGDNLSTGNPILTFRNFMLNRGAYGCSGQFRQAVQLNALTSLKCYICGDSLKRLIVSQGGYEFFANKQKKIIYQIQERFKY